MWLALATNSRHDCGRPSSLPRQSTKSFTGSLPEHDPPSGCGSSFVTEATAAPPSTPRTSVTVASDGAPADTWSAKDSCVATVTSRGTASVLPAGTTGRTMGRAETTSLTGSVRGTAL